MKLKVNESMILVGTPEEMAEFIRLTRMPEKPKAKRVDWPKAEALKAAGWTNKAIAEELGCNPITVSNHFRVKEAEA